MKTLTEQEIETALYAMRASLHWQSYADFVREYYGDKAHSFKVSSELVYNDEYDELEVGLVTVFDETGKEITPDLSLSSWAESIALHNQRVAEDVNGYYTKYPSARTFDYEEGLYEAKKALQPIGPPEHPQTWRVSTPPKLPILVMMEDN
jgi:hypothetical protein